MYDVVMSGRYTVETIGRHAEYDGAVAIAQAEAPDTPKAYVAVIGWSGRTAAYVARIGGEVRVWDARTNYRAFHDMRQAMKGR